MNKDSGVVGAEIVIHPIKPVFDENSEILILGSFPSVKSREQVFFYAHPQNRFWKVIAALFDEKVPYNIEEKCSLLLPQQQNKMKSFFAATCAWQKTLLRGQVCERSECAASSANLSL